jgi:hypothetical protein
MGYDAFEGTEKKQRISRTFHLEMGQIDPLMQASKVLGISQSEVVRRSIDYFLEELGRHKQKKDGKGFGRVLSRTRVTSDD